MLNLSNAIHGIGGIEAAQTIMRVAVGSFFAFSGYHKLFNPQRKANLLATFKADHIPAPNFNVYWVPFWEMTGGAMVAMGLFAAFAASVLSIICITACLAEAKGRITAYKPIDKADWIDDLLYLPEVLYLIMLLPIVAAGAGPFSIDRFIG